jgi:hypothetical protein
MVLSKTLALEAGRYRLSWSVSLVVVGIACPGRYRLEGCRFSNGKGYSRGQLQ